MADIPSNVSYGTVIGRFLLAYADTDDSGLAPDAVPAKGSIFFTPSATVLKNIDASPAAVTILPASVQASLDNNGYLRSFTSTSGTGIRLIATDDDSNNPFNWSWRVEFRLTDQGGAPVSIPSFSFSLPSDSTVDLTEVSPVTESNGVTYISGPRGLPGKGLRIDGSVADASFLPEGTEADQSYVTEDTGHLWIWNTEDWIDVGPFEGTPGEGVPTGGSANSFLSKIDGDDYNTFWSSTIDGGTSDAIQTLVKVRRDSAFNWENENPALEAGEIGFEIDTNRLKVGNGFDVWEDLDYTSGGASVDVSETEPSEASEGKVWFNSTDGRAYIYYDSVWVDLNPGIQGPKGEDSTVEGPQGQPGIDGVGIPEGGVAGDILSKVDSDDYSTTWIPQQFRVFTDVLARTEAINTPTDGMMSYLQDSNDFEASDGTNYVPLVSIGAWKTWAPVLSGGFSNGNGVWDAKYIQIGKTVHFKAFFTAGTTSTFGAGLTLSFPIAARVGTTANLVTGYFAKGTARHPFTVITSTTTGMTLGAQTAGGTYVQTTNMTAIIPFTWASGSTIQIAGTYEAA